jgi:flagellar basal-body rod protein FlgB
MDLNSLPLFKALTRRMAWLGERQQVLAQNVANADTPNYLPRDLKAISFRDMLAGKSGGLKLAATHSNHLAGIGGESKFQAEVQRDVDVSPSGNGVSVEDQMLKVSSTASDHQMMTELYRRHLAMLRSVLGRSA